MRPESHNLWFSAVSVPLLLLIFYALTLSAPLTCLAADSEKGGMDWTRMRLWAKGLGTAPAGTAERLAGPMAERAAILDARRNLVEVLEQVYVDSQTTVADFVTADDVVRNRVYGVLSRPDVVSQQIDAEGVCEVVVSVPIAGELAEILKTRMPQNSALPVAMDKIVEPRRIAGAGREAAPGGTQQQGVRVEKIVKPQRLSPRTEHTTTAEKMTPAPEPEAEPEATPGLKPAALKTNDPQTPSQSPPPVVATKPDIPDYTGLVVDARELGFIPSLTPELHGADALIYPGPDLRSDVVSSGRVRYYRSLEQAQQGAMAGATPLTIRAEGLYEGNKAGLALNPEDADLLQHISKQPDNFLNAGRVAIVF